MRYNPRLYFIICRTLRLDVPHGANSCRIVQKMMPFLDLPPLAAAQGTVSLPGSKSLSNRILLLAALSEGETRIVRLLDSDDTRVMLDGLAQLGVGWERVGDNEVRVQGCAGVFPRREAGLYLGNAGTAFRSLTAVLAFAGGHYRLSGNARMHERPIRDLVDALRLAGAHIDYLGAEGYPPLQISPSAEAAPARVPVRGNVSSQFLTGLLLAAPLSGRDISLVVDGELISRPYVDITLNLMRRFGVVVDSRGPDEFLVSAGAKYHSPGRIEVEGDASSASYFLAAGAIGGGPVRVEGVGRNSIQGDVRFAEVLAQMGAIIDYEDDAITASCGEELRGVDADFNHIPDAAMTVAILALFARGESRLRNIGSWRVKETDRIAAMATELRKVGAEVEAGPDFLRIVPPHCFLPATIDTYDDHRMAMCFSLVALAGVPIRINDPQCVNKTFPHYFEAFEAIVRPEPA